MAVLKAMDKSLEPTGRISTVLVPIKGRPADDEVVRQAALLAKRNKATLAVIYVIVVKQELALDAALPEEMDKGEAVLSRAIQVANEYGVAADSSILQARFAGVAIVEEAIERNADLIMMTVSYRDRFGEFNMGRTIPYVLKHAPCRVWMFREELKHARENQA